MVIKMKAIAYKNTSHSPTLHDIEIDQPMLKEHDLLVSVQAISINPVDYKIRENVTPKEQQWKILGWDAAGIVTAIGSEVSNFKIGDEVWYAGDLTRQGTNAEFHAVDERIVGRKPHNLSFAEAASLPLTAITAWEMLFERLEVKNSKPTDTILIIGASGGVGSIAIQLLKAKTDLKIIATASTPKSRAWLQELGVDGVIDYNQPFAEQLQTHQCVVPKYVFSTSHSEDYLQQIAEIIAPQGKFGLIDDPASLNINAFKTKSVSIHWEFMFTRSMYQTEDQYKQGELLNELATLVEQKQIGPTLVETFSPINANNIQKAHQLLKEGHQHGKIVISAQ